MSVGRGCATSSRRRLPAPAWCGRSVAAASCSASTTSIRRDGESFLDPALGVAARIDDEALRRGLLVYSTQPTADGYAGDQTLLTPAFVSSEEELALIVERMAETVRAVETLDCRGRDGPARTPVTALARSPGARRTGRLHDGRPEDNRGPLPARAMEGSDGHRRRWRTSDRLDARGRTAVVSARGGHPPLRRGRDGGRRAPRRLARHSEGPAHRGHGAVGLRQVDADAHPRRARSADLRRGLDRRHRHHAHGRPGADACSGAATSASSSSSSTSCRC